MRAVSIAARGLWMEMLCIMHEASPYGHLVLGDLVVSNDVLARMAGAGVEEVSALLIELESAGVLSRTRKDVIYSRRMVKDRNRAEKGRKASTKRWSQGAENLREKPQPNRSPNRIPTTQKPEARYQKEEERENTTCFLTGAGEAPALPPDDKPPPLSASEVVDAWNEMADRHDLARIAKLTPARKRNLTARICEYSIDEWKRALGAIERSDFLRGKNDRGWRANFDFLLQPSSFIKLIEGQYDR